MSRPGLQSSTRANMASSAHTPADPSIQAPIIDTMNRKQEVNHIRNLALCANEVVSDKVANISRLRGAANRAQTEARNLMMKAKELIWQANSLEKNPAGLDIKALHLGQLELVRETRKRLRNALARGKKIAKPARKLEERKSCLKLFLDDPKVAAELRKQCLQEIGEVAVALADSKSTMATNTIEGRAPALSTQQEMRTDTDTDELQILEDTAEVRALFEKKAEEGSSALAQAEPQDNARLVSVQDEHLAEQKILVELQAAAVLPIRMQREPERQIQLKNARTRLRQVPERARRVGDYRPTERDMALGVKWTLFSAQTVRHDLSREIQEGGDNAYIACHIAIMRRKLAILQQFRQEPDGPPGAITEELDALDNALSFAEPVVELARVRTAENMLYDTDRRNYVKRMLVRPERDLADLANVRKRQHVDDSTESEGYRSENSEVPRPVKRRRMRHQHSYKTKNLHALGDHHQPQAPAQQAVFNRPQDLGLLGSCSAHESQDTEIMEDEYDSGL